MFAANRLTWALGYLPRRYLHECPSAWFPCFSETNEWEQSLTQHALDRPGCAHESSPRYVWEFSATPSSWDQIYIRHWTADDIVTKYSDSQYVTPTEKREKNRDSQPTNTYLRTVKINLQETEAQDFLDSFYSWIYSPCRSDFVFKMISTFVPYS
jgi:hypothetical protein